MILSQSVDKPIIGLSTDCVINSLAFVVRCVTLKAFYKYLQNKSGKISAHKISVKKREKNIAMIKMNHCDE